MSGVGVRKRGKNASYVHVCPGLALHSAPGDVRPGASAYKRSSTSQPELRSTPLPKLNSSLHPDPSQTERPSVDQAEKRFAGAPNEIDSIGRRFPQTKTFFFFLSKRDLRKNLSLFFF